MLYYRLLQIDLSTEIGLSVVVFFILTKPHPSINNPFTLHLRVLLQPLWSVHVEKVRQVHCK